MKRFILIAAAALSLAACDNTDTLNNADVYNNNSVTEENVVGGDDCKQEDLEPGEVCN